jgi:Tol biopolymer transport system component
MQPVQRAARAHPRGAWVGILAVLTLAAMPLLAASALSAPAAQTVHPVSYLPLVQMTPNERIAFISERDGNAEISVMNADGSQQTRLTNNPGDDLFPVWSPDGRQIAFVSDRDGNQEIYVMNADGTNQTRLTNNPGTDNAPVWSPDGRRIAFDSALDEYPIWNWEIYVMNADGTNQTRLTNSPTYDSRPVWSPDGRQIAFDSGPAAWCCEIYVRCCEIYVMNADGSNQARLSDGTNPVWSPR